jgi:hypothetical protein
MGINLEKINQNLKIEIINCLKNICRTKDIILDNCLTNHRMIKSKMKVTFREEQIQHLMKGINVIRNYDEKIEQIAKEVILKKPIKRKSNEFNNFNLKVDENINNHNNNNKSKSTQPIKLKAKSNVNNPDNKKLDERKLFDNRQNKAKFNKLATNKGLTTITDRTKSRFATTMVGSTIKSSLNEYDFLKLTNLKSIKSEKTEKIENKIINNSNHVNNYNTINNTNEEEAPEYRKSFNLFKDSSTIHMVVDNIRKDFNIKKDDIVNNGPIKIKKNIAKSVEKWKKIKDVCYPQYNTGIFDLPLVSKNR